MWPLANHLGRAPRQNDILCLEKSHGPLRTTALLAGPLPTIPWCPHRLAKAGSGSRRPAQLIQPRVPRALPNHFSEKRAGIRKTVSSGKPHLKAEYTWWNYTPTTILNHWRLLTVMAKKPNYVWENSECGTECVCKPQIAYGAGQDGAEKDKDMIRQLWPKPIHGPNTPGSSPTIKLSHHGYCLTEVKCNEVL